MTSDSLGGEWEESCRWWICALYPGRSFTWHKERLGALSPIYQRTIVVFHYRIYPLFPYSLPHGNPLIRNTAIQVCGHRQGHSPTVRISTFCVYFYLPMYTPQRQKGDKEQLRHLMSLRSHPSELDLTLEDGCGPVVHALTLDGSKALLLGSGSQRSGWTH